MPFFCQQKLESEVTSTTLDIATQKMSMTTKAAATMQVKLRAKNVNKKLQQKDEKIFRNVRKALNPCVKK